MTHSEPPENPGTDNTVNPAQVEHTPTAVFLADPRASVFLLRETISRVLDTYRIQLAYVDLTTLPGLTTAGELMQAGIAYEHLDFGQQVPQADQAAQSAQSAQDQDSPGKKSDKRFKPSRPRTLEDYAYLRHMSAGTHTVQLSELADIDANLVLIPAMTDDGLIDFSQDTLMGSTLAGAEATGRDLLILMPPERGLRSVPVDPEAQEAQEAHGMPEVPGTPASSAGTRGIIPPALKDLRRYIAYSEPKPHVILPSNMLADT